MPVNPLKPTKYQGADQWQINSLNVPAKSSSPDSGDLRNPLTGAYYGIGDIWVNVATRTPFMFGGTASGAPVWLQLTAPGGTVSGSTVLVAGIKVIAAPTITANSVVATSVTTLGTVTTAKAMLITLNPGVGFTITSSDNTDTSTVKWSIVA